MKNFLTQLVSNVYVAAATLLYTLITIAWSLLSWLNWMPFYQVKLHNVNSITPIFNFMPGQQIRLGYDAYRVIVNGEIDWVRWYLLKNEKVIFQDEGQALTLQLPPKTGGTYKLKAAIKLSDNTILTGQTNFYVVQDKPKEITVQKDTTIEISSSYNPPKLLDQIRSQGAVEIYTTKGWKTVPVHLSPQGNASVTVKKTETFSTYGDQIPIRAQGTTTQFGNYGAISAPSFEYKPK